VSHVLQQIAAVWLADRSTASLLTRAQRLYTERRAALVEALADRGIAAAGDSGLGVWIPLADEAAAVSGLLVEGWSVSPGERYRFRTPPGIRVTTADLQPAEAERLAAALASLLRATSTTYAG
jgi:DNA-binding transcriptional MocR family regulator